MATLSKAARSAGSRLWKKDFREGWNPPGEEGFFFAALPSTSPWRRFALDPNAAGEYRTKNVVYAEALTSLICNECE